MNRYTAVDQQGMSAGKHAERALSRKMERNQKRALELEAAMFQWRSRHLILVLTLSYQDCWKPLMTFEDIQRDRDRFFNNARCNQLLQPINGYVWVIEEGMNGGGFHMHIVIFYDGSHRADVYFAEEIGEYWKRVATGGRGDYWNSNGDKEKFAGTEWGNATGQIDRDDEMKRQSLRNYLLGYMTKPEQQASRPNAYCHAFGTSRLPM